jgi:hypothetical protein
MGTLKVRLDDTPETGGVQTFSNTPFGGGTLSGNGRSGGVLEVDTDRLAASMRELKTQLAQVFADIREVGQFELSSIELGLEINTEGGFNLIGSVRAGAKGAIKLKFEPPKPKA